MITYRNDAHNQTGGQVMISLEQLEVIIIAGLIGALLARELP